MAQLGGSGGVGLAARVRALARRAAGGGAPVPAWTVLPGLLVAACIVSGSLLAWSDLGSGSAAPVVVERGDREGPDAPREAGGAAEAVDAVVVVDVSGAVAAPGVVSLPEGSRVGDAIDAAGGLAADADVAELNRAEVVSDGQKVTVPRQGDPPARVPAAETGAPAAAMASGKVNINTADESELDALPGVGPSTARSIIEDRERNGSFTSPEDIMRVSGIGEKKFERLRDLISI